MSIKVTGGYLGGRILKTLPGRDTRPTTARVREAIFSILQHDLEGATVLDICAGSGALAIEAISRGAASAVLIEKNKAAARVIDDNLRRLGLALRVIVADWHTGLEKLAREKAVFRLAFADPPYGLVTPEGMYRSLSEYHLMECGGFLIMEHAGQLTPEEEQRITTRRFGDSAITIFKYD